MLRCPDQDLPVWVSGRWVPLTECRIPVESPLVLAGYGAFETIAVRDGVPLEWPEHRARLERGVARLGGADLDADELDVAVAEGAARLAGDGWLKVLWGAPDGPILFGGRRDPAADEGEFPTVRAVGLPWPKPRRGPFTGCKLTHWADALAGRREAERRGADEGLWHDDRGHLAEACAANLFLVEPAGLRTPPVSAAVLPGVVRGRILMLAEGCGLRAIEAPIRPERLRRAREAFLTSSVQGVRALVEWDRRRIGDGTAGPWTRRLAAALDRTRHEEVRRFAR